MKNIMKDKVFLKTMLTLAIPITIQTFISSSLNLVDNLMVGSLGEQSIAAVGLANQFFFIFMLCLSGINAGASVFMAQYWGKREINSIKKMMGIDITIGFIVSTAFALLAIFFGENIMSILSKDIEVIRIGNGYLRIVAISFIFTNFTQGYSAALRSTEQTKIPMYGSIIGIFINAIFNWILIFGGFGIKAMGVNGAAIATTIARLIEMIFVVGVVYGYKNKVAAKIKELFSFDINLVKIYFKTSTSVIVNELLWSLGLTAYSIAYASIGTSAVVTMQIATTLNNMFMVITIGLASATSIMVGNKLGAGEEDVAKDYSKKIGKISPVIGFVIGLILWGLAPIIVKPFNVEVGTFNDAVTVLRIMALFFPLRFYNCVMIIGVFRGGGDTLYSMVVQLGTIWLYAVPIAFIGAMKLEIAITSVYFLISCEEIVKIIFEQKRLKSGKWIKNIIQLSAN